MAFWLVVVAVGVGRVRRRPCMKDSQLRGHEELPRRRMLRTVQRPKQLLHGQGGAGAVLVLGLVCISGCMTELPEVVMRPLREPARSVDEPPRFEVIRKAPDGTEQILADLAVAVVTVEDEPWLVTPERLLLRVTAAGERHVLDNNVVVAPVVEGDLVAWVAGTHLDNEIKVHQDGQTRVVAGGLTAVSSLRFAPDGRHLLVVGAGDGAVVGLHVVDMHGGRVQCLTNCDVRIGEAWRDRFVPLPPRPDALEFDTDKVSWVAENHEHVVRWLLPNGTWTEGPELDEPTSISDLTTPPVVQRAVLVPPPQFHGTLSFPGRCPSGGWSCLYVANHVDVGGIKDYNCMANTYSTHWGIDYVESGVANVVAAAPGTVVLATDGNFDQCTACANSGDCSFNASNQVVIDHGSGLYGFYVHMAKGSIVVQQGDVVTCGQHLGEAGSSGCSTTAHLHFGAVRDFDVQDPGSSAYDPYAGPCSPTPVSLWVEQGPYGGLPGVAETGCGTLTCAPGSDLWVCDVTMKQRKHCFEGRDVVEPCPDGWNCAWVMGEATCVDPLDEGGSTSSADDGTTSDPGVTTAADTLSEDTDTVGSDAGNPTADSGGDPTSDPETATSDAATTTSNPGSEETSPDTSAGMETGGGGVSWDFPSVADERDQGCTCKTSPDDPEVSVGWFLSLIGFGWFGFGRARRGSMRKIREMG